MSKKPTPASWKKGQSGNPAGRTPIILPALQKYIDQNKSKLKEVILSYCNLTEEQLTQRLAGPEVPMVEVIVVRILQEAGVNGDIDRFRKLMEIVFGRLPEDKSEFDVSPEEKEMVIEYRRRLQLQAPTKKDDDVPMSEEQTVSQGIPNNS